MDKIYDKCCGVDVHKKLMVACFRQGRKQEIREFGATTRELLETIGEEPDSELAAKCDIDLKYEGYISKARKEAEKLQAMEQQILGLDFNYDEVDNLSLEGRQKLVKYKPATMGQASRISGVNPADLAVLAIAIRQGKGRRTKENEI